MAKGAQRRTMGLRLFLSHNSHDAAIGKVIRRRARQYGADVYLYEFDVRPGKPIADKIKTEILLCDAVIVLLTHNSVRSPYVHQEIGLAEGMKKPIIPIVEGVVQDADLALLKGREYVCIDPQDPSEAVRQLAPMLNQMKVEKTRQAAVTLMLLMFVVGMLVLLLFDMLPAGTSPQPEPTKQTRPCFPRPD